MDYGFAYLDEVMVELQRLKDTQGKAILGAAQIMAETILRGNNLYVFGCSHAGILAEEAFYRTGGLAVLNPIFFPAMMPNTRPITMTSALERLSGIGTVLIDEHGLKRDDMLIIHSVSGRNTVPIEMALVARERGIFSLAITNIAYSSASLSRHPGGERLFEICDMVIDNCGCFGDGAVQIEGHPEAVGPTSTVLGAAAINAIIVEAVAILIAKGQVPPVFRSANIDGGDAFNRELLKEYREHIFYMR